MFIRKGKGQGKISGSIEVKNGKPTATKPISKK